MMHITISPPWSFSYCIIYNFYEGIKSIKSISIHPINKFLWAVTWLAWMQWTWLSHDFHINTPAPGRTQSVLHTNIIKIKEWTKQHHELKKKKKLAGGAHLPSKHQWDGISQRNIPEEELWRSRKLSWEKMFTGHSQRLSKKHSLVKKINILSRKKQFLCESLTLWSMVVEAS